MVNNKEYISLTDLARYADEEEPRFQIQNWMRNKDVISYLGLWENIHNEAGSNNKTINNLIEEK